MPGKYSRSERYPGKEVAVFEVIYEFPLLGFINEFHNSTRN
jgi:hypothetical protein